MLSSRSRSRSNHRRSTRSPKLTSSAKLRKSPAKNEHHSSSFAFRPRQVNGHYPYNRQQNPKPGFQQAQGSFFARQVNKPAFNSNQNNPFAANNSASNAIIKNKSAILSHLNLNTKARDELAKRKQQAKLEKEKEGNPI